MHGGHLWKFFDISGHSFILVYSSFVPVEKARSIIDWENIKDQSEQRNRIQHHISVSNPLRNLEDNELIDIKMMYDKYPAIIHIHFLLMTTLLVLWDSLLVCGTKVYYHTMIGKKMLPFQKCIAILILFFLHAICFP